MAAQKPSSIEGTNRLAAIFVTVRLLYGSVSETRTRRNDPHGGWFTIDEDDDMLSAMSRELVVRNGIGDTADSVWRALSTEHQKLFPTNSHSDDGASSIEMPLLLETQPDPASRIEGATDTASIEVFG